MRIQIFSGNDQEDLQADLDSWFEEAEQHCGAINIRSIKELASDDFYMLAVVWEPKPRPPKDLPAEKDSTTSIVDNIMGE